jgi:hypothetical protein
VATRATQAKDLRHTDNPNQNDEQYTQLSQSQRQNGTKPQPHDSCRELQRTFDNQSTLLPAITQRNTSEKGTIQRHPSTQLVGGDIVASSIGDLQPSSNMTRKTKSGNESRERRARAGNGANKSSAGACRLIESVSPKAMSAELSKGNEGETLDEQGRLLNDGKGRLRRSHSEQPTPTLFVVTVNILQCTWVTLHH